MELDFAMLIFKQKISADLYTNKFIKLKFKHNGKD